MKFGVACATVGLILGGSVMAGAWEKALDERVDAAKDAQVKAVQEVIAIKSYNHGSPTTPSEGVKQALDAMLAMAEKLCVRNSLLNHRLYEAFFYSLLSNYIFKHVLLSAKIQFANLQELIIFS